MRSFFAKSQKSGNGNMYLHFEPTKIYTRSAPQNDHLKLSFLKHIYEDGRKLARNGCKMANVQLAFVSRKFWLICRG